MTTVNESNSPDSSIQSSSDVDHDATSNRDHDGDVLTPESVQTDVLGIAGFEIVTHLTTVDVGGEVHGSGDKVNIDVSGSDHDAYVLVIENGGNGGGGVHLYCQINGYTATNYRFRETNGVLTTDKDHWELVRSGYGSQYFGAFLFQNAYPKKDVSPMVGPVRSAARTKHMTDGCIIDSNFTKPIDSFQIWEDHPRTFYADVKFKVLGADVL